MDRKQNNPHRPASPKRTRQSTLPAPAAPLAPAAAPQDAAPGADGFARD
ncbi:MAG: hypothetical protein LBM92_05360 [Opitutaceae bacterium]|jgi:hypothetical protein|nr:hypothetical protein [Opitutaceae bacterium]